MGFFLKQFYYYIKHCVRVSPLQVCSHHVAHTSLGSRLGKAMLRTVFWSWELWHDSLQSAIFKKFHTSNSISLYHQQQILVAATTVCVWKMQYRPSLPQGKRRRHLYLLLADTLHIPLLNYFLCLCDGEVKGNDKSEGMEMEFIYCINGSFLWDPFKPSLLKDWRNDSLGSCESWREEKDLRRGGMKESIAYTSCFHHVLCCHILYYTIPGVCWWSNCIGYCILASRETKYSPA